MASSLVEFVSISVLICATVGGVVGAVYALVANLLDTVASRFANFVELLSISVLMAVTVGGVVVLMVPVIGIVATCAAVGNAAVAVTLVSSVVVPEVSPPAYVDNPLWIFVTAAELTDAEVIQSVGADGSTIADVTLPTDPLRFPVMLPVIPTVHAVTLARPSEASLNPVFGTPDRFAPSNPKLVER